jgi:hypothetical protein
MAVPKATLIDPKTISTTGAPVATLIDPSTVTPGAIAKNTYKEVPLKIRFLVEGAPNMESKIATLKKFYPEVKQIEDSNFLVTDAKGTTHIFDDREKTTIGDFIDASKEITEMIASTVGAIGGSAAGPVGTIAGSGAGLALGAEIFERVAQQFGTEMLRTPEEYAKQRASDFAFGSVGQAVAPIVFKGAKYAITGGAKKVAEAGERLASFINAGVSPSLGQVTFNRAIQTVELALGSIPGSSGYIAKFAQKAQDDFGNTLAKLASKTLADDGILIKGGTMAIPDETVVGSLIGTKEQGLLKQLYGSISSDIETNVLSIGGTKAMNALRRANRVWQAGNKKLEDFLQPIFNKANPDTLVKDLMASAREGSTRLLALKNSFKPEQYKALVSSIIDKMGRISPGQGIAGELGEEVTGQIGRFSSETFLTNWNKLSPAAKETLFSGKGFPKSMVKDLNDLLQVSNVIRESGKTFRNPSGTADRLAGIGIGIGGAVGVVTGNPMFLAAMPLVMFGANVTSKLMTNPRFVSWAAQATKIAGNKGIEGMAEHITKLGAIAASAGPEERQALFEYMGILKEAADKENKIIKPEPPVAKKVSEAPIQPTERQQVASATPVLDRSMFPSTSTMTNVSTPTTGGQGLASISGNQFKSLFPGDTLGAAYMENKNA